MNDFISRLNTKEHSDIYILPFGSFVLYCKSFDIIIFPLFISTKVPGDPLIKIGYVSIKCGREIYLGGSKITVSGGAS